MSPVKGLPGASRIMKNETVISTSMVGMAESMRRMMNFSISYLLGAWWVGICLNTGRSSERGSDAWGGFLFFVVRPLVLGCAGFCFYGRLKRDFGFQTTFLLMFFVGKAHATAFMVV